MNMLMLLLHIQCLERVAEGCLAAVMALVIRTLHMKPEVRQLVVTMRICLLLAHQQVIWGMGG
jgi:hypothetical protein